jgi:hypothetical protein
MEQGKLCNEELNSLPHSWDTQIKEDGMVRARSTHTRGDEFINHCSTIS